MVNVTVCGDPVVLWRVPEMSPLPLAAIPVTLVVLSLVQAKVVPVRLLLVDKTIVAIATLEQTV